MARAASASASAVRHRPAATRPTRNTNWCQWYVSNAAGMRAGSRGACLVAEPVLDHQLLELALEIESSLHLRCTRDARIKPRVRPNGRRGRTDLAARRRVGDRSAEPLGLGERVGGGAPELGNAWHGRHELIVLDERRVEHRAACDRRGARVGARRAAVRERARLRGQRGPWRRRRRPHRSARSRATPSAPRTARPGRRRAGAS